MSTPPALVDLRLALTRLFDAEELRTLCFDLGVDYDSLPASGKAGKARELVALAERTGRLKELETAARCERPNLGTVYSQERVQELQASIMAGSAPRVRDAFVEFTHQIDAYLDRFNLLHEQLEEWKEVHNVLQDVQSGFAPCRSYIFTLSRLGTAGQVERERALYEVEVEWRPCRRSLGRLRQLAEAVATIGEPYDTGSGAGPEWFVAPWESAQQIDRALFESDVLVLVDRLSEFGDQVDRLLYLVDKALRDVVRRINRLPRPETQAVRS